MALGEAGTRVRLHVLADALRLGALGIAIGAVLAYGSAHYLRAFVAGNVRARDPIMLARDDADPAARDRRRSLAAGTASEPSRSVARDSSRVTCGLASRQTVGTDSTETS